MDIVFLTARRDKGPTGGPGGVLYLCKVLLGNKFGQHKLHYHFISDNQWNQGVYNGSVIMVNEITKKYDSAYYICHDIGTAYALAQKKLPYSLIFHHQGSLIEEIITIDNNKITLENEVTEILLEWEKGAFENANSVHFPSDGACNAFFDSGFSIVDKNNVNIGDALYNTILLKEKSTISNIDKYIIPDENFNTFLSVGTQTVAKGQDKIPNYLEKLLKEGEKIHWINIGVGVLTEKVDYLCNILSSKYPDTFKYNHLHKVPHSHLMELYTYCDYYIMLHNISIFDFATLEAMVNDCVIILSDVYGNKDFNKENNIIMENEYTLAFNKNFYKKLNKRIFDENFSPECFKKSYYKLISEVVPNV